VQNPDFARQPRPQRADEPRLGGMPDAEGSARQVLQEEQERRKVGGGFQGAPLKTLIKHGALLRLVVS